MPAKSVKTVKTTKPSTRASASSAVKKTRAAPRRVSSRAVPTSDQSKYTFLTAAVLTAAALAAVAIGFSTYSHSSSGKLSSDNKAVMFIQSDSGLSATRGETLTVKLYENSGSESVNAVQGSISYPADKLKLVSVRSDGDFSKEAATDTSTPGLVRVARSVNTANEVLQGVKKVVTLEFTVSPMAAGSATLHINKDASLIVRSSDNTNVLQHIKSATYTIH